MYDFGRAGFDPVLAWGQPRGQPGFAMLTGQNPAQHLDGDFEAIRAPAAAAAAGGQVNRSFFHGSSD